MKMFYSKSLIIISIVAVLSFGIGRTALLFNCGALHDVCDGKEICMTCVSSDHTIAWSINGQTCLASFGYYDSNGDEKNLSGNCDGITGKARVIYGVIGTTPPLISQVCFNLTSNFKNISCSTSNFSNLKTCSTILKRKPVKVSNVTVSGHNVMWNTQPDVTHYKLSVVNENHSSIHHVKNSHITLNLQKGHKYNVTVTAVNCNGESDPSVAVHVSTVVVPLPNNINVTFHNGISTIKWGYDKDHCYTVKQGKQIHYCNRNGSFKIELQNDKLHTLQIAPHSVTTSMHDIDWHHEKEICIAYFRHFQPDITSNIAKNNTLDIHINTSKPCKIIRNCICPPATTIILKLSNSSGPFYYTPNMTLIKLQLSNETKAINVTVLIANDCGVSQPAVLYHTISIPGSTDLPSISSTSGKRSLYWRTSSLVLLFMLLLVLIVL